MICRFLFHLHFPIHLQIYDQWRNVWNVCYKFYIYSDYSFHQKNQDFMSSLKEIDLKGISFENLLFKISIRVSLKCSVDCHSLNGLIFILESLWSTLFNSWVNTLLAESFIWYPQVSSVLYFSIDWSVSISFSISSSTPPIYPASFSVSFNWILNSVQNNGIVGEANMIIPSIFSLIPDSVLIWLSEQSFSAPGVAFPAIFYIYFHKNSVINIFKLIITYFEALRKEWLCIWSTATNRQRIFPFIIQVFQHI